MKADKVMDSESDSHKLYSHIDHQKMTHAGKYKSGNTLNYR